jgi:hypothetical protein
MKNRAPWLLAAALLPALAAPADAQVKDAVDLLPAQTLACVELRHPEKLAREVAALLRGSALDDLPATIAKFRAKQPERGGFLGPAGDVAAWGMLFSPEMINEGGRLQGGCLALTGIGRDGSAEWAGILLAGESNIPTLIMRAVLSFSDAHIVAENEGFPVYRERYLRPPQPGEQPKWEEHGPYMATLPGGVLAFTGSLDGMKDVIARFKRKKADPALSSLTAYREAARQREKPGLYIYVNLGALSTSFDDLAKRNADAAAAWNQFKAVINPAAMRGATGSLTLTNGALEFLGRVDLDPKGHSPFVAVLPEKGAGLDVLQFVPRDALVSLTMSMADGEKRWQAFVALADAVSKAGGQLEGNFPSKKIKEAEERLGLRIGKDVFARVKAIALFADEVALAPPMLILEAADADAAKALLGLVPKVVAAVTGGDVAEAKPGQIDGVPVRTVGVPFGLAKIDVAYGRQGAMLVVGLGPKRVAAALAAGAEKQGQLSDRRVGDALKSVDGALAAGVLTADRALVELVREVNNPRALPRFGPRLPRELLPHPKEGEELARLLKETAAAAEALPPGVMSLTRKEDTFILEMRQPGLRSVSAKVVTVWVEAGLRGVFGPKPEEAPKKEEALLPPVRPPMMFPRRLPFGGGYSRNDPRNMIPR